MESVRVLLVDDDEDFSNVLSERLTNRSVSVELAKDGFEAINMVKENNYDAVILDFAMPGPDGIETLEVLLSKRPNLQVILLTGQATLEKGVKALKLGAMDVLEKPGDISNIMEKINQAQSNKMLLVSKEAQERIQDILKSKGW